MKHVMSSRTVYRWRREAGVVLLLILCSCSGPSESSRDVDRAYEQATEERLALGTVDARLKIVRAFLNEFPVSRHSPEAIWLACYYMHELGDSAGGLAYAKSLRDQADDPELVYEIDRRMMTMYGRCGETGTMLDVARTVEQRDGLSFATRKELIEVLIEAADWPRALELCQQSCAYATDEAFRREWAGEDLTDAQVEAAVANRQAILDSHQGWAKANLGRVEEALDDFASAASGIRRSYLGVPDADLNLRWGQTLVGKQELGEAIDLLAADAVILGRDEAMEALERAYAGIHSDTADFDHFARSKRLEIARVIDDFTLPDYQGERRLLSDLRDRVTLLAFWFPT
jgi:tetratricopeptide (TPR) repeat protein